MFSFSAVRSLVAVCHSVIVRNFEYLNFFNCFFKNLRLQQAIYFCRRPTLKQANYTQESAAFSAAAGTKTLVRRYSYVT